MFIIRSIILLSLFDIYFNYLTFILLSLLDFNFRESLNSYFSHIFIVRSIVSLLLFDDYFIYSTLDVKKREDVNICDCKENVIFSSLLFSFQRRKY